MRSLVTVIAVLCLAGICVILVPVCGIGGMACNWAGEAADVAYEEVSPRALLTKYEWFKDVSAQLDKKQADIQVFAARSESLAEAYLGVPRKDWPRHDAMQSAQWAAECVGVKSSYNGLAAEYNAAMVKLNYAFCNVGDLPKGATVPLPRNYKPYVID